MGNKCCACMTQANNSTDEAEDALLGHPNNGSPVMETRRRRRILNTTAATPRGPPPPYQVSQVHPFYMLSEEQRLQIIARITLIQSLPVGRYQSDKKLPPLSTAAPLNNTGATCSEKKMEKTDTNRECPICMNDFLPGEVIRLLPCMHFYHIRCIDDWLMRAVTCPTCVQRVDSGHAQQPHPPQTHQRTNSSSSTGQRSSSTDVLHSPPSSSSSQEFNFQTTTTAEIHS